jgi:methyl-accepting chemotaxis protein
VGDIIAEIAAATGEQSTGIDQVNRAMTAMDQVVQRNARETDDLTGAARALAVQAQQLQTLVGRFRLAHEAEGPARSAAADPPAPLAPVAPPRPRPVRGNDLVLAHAGNGHGNRHAPAARDHFEEF